MRKFYEIWNDEIIEFDEDDENYQKVFEINEVREGAGAIYYVCSAPNGDTVYFGEDVSEGYTYEEDEAKPIEDYYRYYGVRRSDFI